MNYKNLFYNLRLRNSKALIPYFTAFYPSRRMFENFVVIASKAGADIIEIGLPFSDPLADGPVIQHSSQYALDNGFNVSEMFESISKMRAKVHTPLVIMTYLNPVLRRGIRRFIRDCKNSGISGLVIPDMIPEEGEMLQKEASLSGIAINYLLAPTTTVERIRLIASKTTGFIYLVSVKGVTGERRQLPDYLPKLARKIRSITDKPLCIGFGISTVNQAKEVSKLCDGVIIGSALVKRTEPRQMERFLRRVKQEIS